MRHAWLSGVALSPPGPKTVSFTIPACPSASNLHITEWGISLAEGRIGKSSSIPHPLENHHQPLTYIKDLQFSTVSRLDRLNQWEIKTICRQLLQSLSTHPVSTAFLVNLETLFSLSTSPPTLYLASNSSLSNVELTKVFLVEHGTQMKTLSPFHSKKKGGNAARNQTESSCYWIQFFWDNHDLDDYLHRYDNIIFHSK